MPFSDSDLVWPEKAPDAILGYAMDLTQGELDPGDSVTSAAVSVSPSGDPKDLIISAPAGVLPVLVAEGMLSVWFRNGVPGRVYMIHVLLQTLNHATLSLTVSLPITRTFAEFPISEPVSAEFTSPVIWPP